MTTNKAVYAFLCTIVALLAMSAVFLMTQRLAHAEDSLAEQINCEVYAQLAAQGLPIPPEFATICGGGNGGTGGGNETPVDPCEIINMNPLVPDCDEDDDGGNGGGGGGGGGGTGGGAACSDTIDNDNDGKTDLADPGCSNADDTDETDPTTGGGSGSTDGGGSGSGGGSGGGGGGSTGGSTATSTGETLGSSTSTIACDQYLTSFIKFGATNDEEQVKRLQHVLKDFEGAAVEVNGVFDQSTLTAVHAFQTKYWDTILAPWDIKQSTGYVYLTTRKKVNEVYCKNTIVFPLSQDETKLIEATKKAPVKASVAAVATVQPAVKEPEVVETKPITTTTSEEPVVRRSSVGNFFRRLIDWVR